MKLIISNVSGVPIYEQIKQQIKAAILSGELQAEETLPSLRTLAKDLKISVLTVTKAYTELEQEGFVKNVQISCSLISSEPDPITKHPRPCTFLTKPSCSNSVYDWKVSQVEKSISVFYPNWDSQKFADMLRKFNIAPTKKEKNFPKVCR